VDIRFGIGYDIHPLEKGRKLILGGVAIPHKKGPIGHSDADVLVHAVIDALFGAAGLGDIGHHFPDTDPAYRDAHSIDLLKESTKKIKSLGFSLNNLDATIVCEKPMLKDYIPRMKENIAGALDADPSAVNIKATRSEGIGCVGKERGISTFAIVSLKK
jgi:2-C-methyl-D-erythritol 2,4-cyclodiphosphate synthase